MLLTGILFTLVGILLRAYAGVFEIHRFDKEATPL